MAETKLKVYKYPKGSLIFVEGATNSKNFYIIREGEAKISREVEIVDSPHENLLDAGDYFGVVACLSKRPRLETVRALTEVSAISVDYDQFIDLIKNNKSVADKILKLYSKRLRTFDNAIARLSLKKPISSNAEGLYNIGVYYYNCEQFPQAKYAFEKFSQFCPRSVNIQMAYKLLNDLKQKVKTEEKKIADDQMSRIYPDKSILFLENEPGEEVYIVQQGKIKITKIVGNQEVLLAVLNPGDTVGEMALIEDKLRSANAIAFGQAKVLVITKANFQIMVQQRPEIYIKVIQILSERIWIAYRQLENLAIPDDYGRILDLMLIQVQKMRIPLEAHAVFRFDFGVEDLLKMAGYDQDKGYTFVTRLFEDSNYKLDNGKIVTMSLEELSKQVALYRKKMKKDISK